jgi:predicted nucleic acid-binding protein
MIKPVLLDNTVLSNFALVGRTPLVFGLWPQAACTTPAALAEFHAGVEKGRLHSPAWEALPLVEPTAAELATAAGLASRLGSGERTCLAVVWHRAGLLASDDLDARRAADRLGVPTTGTVGILLACTRQAQLSLTEADALLREMVTLGYRAPVDGLGTLICQPRQRLR